MKLSLVSILIALVAMPFISFFLSSWYTSEVREIYENHPHVEIISTIQTIDDVSKIKEMYLKGLESKRRTEKISIGAHQEFTDMLLVFAIGNVIFLFFLYRVLRKMVYNKSSKPTTKSVSA